jgi:hypothetical protein
MGGAGGGGTGLNSSWLGGSSGGSSFGTGGGLSDPNFDLSNYLPGFGEDYNANDPAGWTQTYTTAAEKERKRQELMDMLQGLSDAFGKQQQGARPQQAQLPGIGSASGPGPAAPPKMNDVRYTLPLIAQLMGWGAEADPRNPVILQIANRRK